MHLKKLLALFLILFIYGLHSLASPAFMRDTNSISIKNLQNTLQLMVAHPHPMGSLAQKKLAQELAARLQKFGLKTAVQPFTALAPQVQNLTTGYSNQLVPLNGYNVVALRPGYDNCALVLAGHYDSKFFKNQIFLGANDGGSSTALLLELARVSFHRPFASGSLGACFLYFVLFDGEEALLSDWNAGQRSFHQQDNLYGSREFVQHFLNKQSHLITIEKHPLILVIVLDMIGHKNQKLSITSMSEPQYAQEFIKSSKGISVLKSNLFIEDDHQSFLRAGAPVLHIIDWSNLEEWHTSKDNLDIISDKKIAYLGATVLSFLNTKVIEH